MQMRERARIPKCMHAAFSLFPMKYGLRRVMAGAHLYVATFSRRGLHSAVTLRAQCNRAHRRVSRCVFSTKEIAFEERDPLSYLGTAKINERFAENGGLAVLNDSLSVAPFYETSADEERYRACR